MRNIPPQTGRNILFPDGSDLKPGFFNPDLVSYRNPKGSTYVEELIREIDSREKEDE